MSINWSKDIASLEHMRYDKDVPYNLIKKEELIMAGGNDQNKKANRQNNRLSPGIAQGTSRVSKVV
jgi:hypothetical protein